MCIFLLAIRPFAAPTSIRTSTRCAHCPPGGPPTAAKQSNSASGGHLGLLKTCGRSAESFAEPCTGRQMRALGVKALAAKASSPCRAGRCRKRQAQLALIPLPHTAQACLLLACSECLCTQPLLLRLVAPQRCLPPAEGDGCRFAQQSSIAAKDLLMQDSQATARPSLLG